MRIIVACGGCGPEREVSLNSGEAVARALREGGHRAETSDPVSVEEFLACWARDPAEGVFVALHGDFGEDGRFQACLDRFGIPYTGSGPGACALAMDKDITKAIFRRRGIPVPEGETVRRDGALARLEVLLGRYGRVVVKPTSFGSTVGVSIVSELSEAAVALDEAFALDDRILIEAYVAGSELTVAIFDDGHPRALPPVEIRPHSGMYDYGSKYTKGRTDYLCPAPLLPVLDDRVRELALRAHEALGCRIYSRVDFRVSPEGEPFVLEVNTAPGMTGTSLVPKAAAAEGWSFPELVDRICRASFSVTR
jgi:D-alanine-D-alanine ligase